MIGRVFIEILEILYRFITEYIHPWLVNDELSFQRSKPLRIFDSNRFVDNVRGTVKHVCNFKLLQASN